MEQKKISWKLLAFMAFSTVWGFGNVVNGFVWFNFQLDFHVCLILRALCINGWRTWFRI